MRFILVLLLLFSNAFAVECDCDVKVFSPLTGSHRMPPMTLKTYKLEEFNNITVKNQEICRNSCLKKFEEDMPVDRIHALLLSYTQELIYNKAVGYNCTGLTTLKYPVRVKATLGSYGLGNVSDIVHVVTHEELCF